jgi:hypothetical protein
MALIQIEEVKKLRELCEKIAAGVAPAVMLVGPPGQGKTETLKNAIGKRPYLYLRGRVSAPSLYQKLYHHRDQLVVLDDTAEMLKDRQVQELLRDLSETTRSRVISWHTQSPNPIGKKIPDSFQTKSPLCVIANEIGIDGVWPALKSRCMEVQVHFTWPDLIKEVRRNKWFKNEEILAYVEKNARCVPDLRLLTTAESVKRLGIADWKQLFGSPERPLGASVDWERLVTLIGRDPGIGLEELHRRVGWDVKSHVLRKTLGEMIGEGVIRQTRQKTNGRPATRYWLVDSDRPASRLPELRARKDGVWRRALAWVRQLVSSKRSRP